LAAPHFGRDGCHRDGAGPAPAPAPLPEKPLLPEKALAEKKPAEAFGPFKPFSHSDDASLDAGQRRFLADLIERYTSEHAVPRK